jgi:effector-binding domain-containing protein
MKLPVGTLKSSFTAILLLLTLLLARNTYALEKPDYEVLLDLGKIEYRRYEPYLVIETVVAGDDLESAMDIGFERLAGYIGGNNRSNAEISMTVPVEMARTEIKMNGTGSVSASNTPEGVRMTFMLPSEFTLQTAPMPTDETVEVKELPERVLAAIRFSGRWTEKNLTSNESKLVENIEEQNLETVGPSVFAAYHPPFMPPFFRRNEILFEVSGLPQELRNNSVGD